MANCALCSAELKFGNTPIAGGYFNNGERICRFCAKKLNKANPSLLFNLKKHSKEDAETALKQYEVSSQTKGGKPNSLKGIIAILIGVVVLGVIFNKGCSSEEIKYTKEQQDSIYAAKNQIMAKIMARNFVKDVLKSPASAEFENEKVWYLKDSTFMVKGTVDSQNSFGAMLRSYFECKVKQVDRDNWIVLERNVIPQ